MQAGTSERYKYGRYHLPLIQIRLPLLFVPIIYFYYAIVCYQEPYRNRLLETTPEQATGLRNRPGQAFCE